MAYKLDKNEAIAKLSEKHPNLDFSNFSYTNSRTKSKVICKDCNNKWEATYRNLYYNNSGCPICSFKKLNLKDKDHMISKINELYDGYNFDKFEYKGSHEKSIVICPNGHEWYVRPIVLYKGCKCPKCTQSKYELEINEFIKSFYKGTILLNDRTVIPSPFSNLFLELDIYLPELNFAIEFNGMYWHSDKVVKKKNWKSAKEKHEYKYNECFKRNIFLLHIDEIEWIKDKNSILNRIKRLIQINKRMSNVCI